MTIMAK